MRTLAELVNTEQSALPWIENRLQHSAVSVELLPCENPSGEQALLSVQVTTKSPMGAILYGSAGILLDHGWLRILGAGGHPKLRRSLPQWNEGRSSGFLLVADDALGGQFALNGGRFEGKLGEVFYFAPDTLGWEATGQGYSEFLTWAMSEGALAAYYKSLRWPGWESEIEALTGDQTLSVYPFLFLAGPIIAERSRRPVPAAENFELLSYLREQIGGQG